MRRALALFVHVCDVFYTAGVDIQLAYTWMHGLNKPRRWCALFAVLHCVQPHAYRARCRQDWLSRLNTETP